MPLRLKKIIGSLAICLFVLFWIGLAVSISGFIPRHWFPELVFYAVMGLGWGVPIFPILKWMETTKPVVRR